LTLPISPETPAAKKTVLNAVHRALRAKMVDFGGWDMPVEYPTNGGGLIAEHMAVRTGVGLFDVSHMGQIRFSGSGALDAIQRITMNDAGRLADGQIQYSSLLTPSGTYVDDILVHRLGAEEYLLVVMPGPRRRTTPGFANRWALGHSARSTTTPAITLRWPYRGRALWKLCKS